MKNLQVKKAKAESFNLVAVVTENDSVVVAGAFKDDETAEQVFSFLVTLKDRQENLLPPYVSFDELCSSWTQGKEAKLIKFKRHLDE